MVMGAAPTAAIVTGDTLTFSGLASFKGVVSMAVRAVLEPSLGVVSGVVPLELLTPLDADATLRGNIDDGFDLGGLLSFPLLLWAAAI